VAGLAVRARGDGVEHGVVVRVVHVARDVDRRVEEVVGGRGNA
jgi:hypothetical protein